MFNKYVLSTDCVPGSVLLTGCGSVVSKTNKLPSPTEPTFRWEDRQWTNEYQIKPGNDQERSNRAMTGEKLFLKG